MAVHDRDGAATPCSAKRPPRIPLHPACPERVCWGCDKYCPADDLACGNGTIRTPHPIELFGPDWVEWCEERSQRPEIKSKGP